LLRENRDIVWGESHETTGIGKGFSPNTYSPRFIFDLAIEFRQAFGPEHATAKLVKITSHSIVIIQKIEEPIMRTSSNVKDFKILCP
tara:strand:+ start:1675 stop:1935 length:261 start_codon:yes stop_codon:yes gene_type:complete